MKYCWTTLHVQDLERSLKFYRDLLGIPVVNLIDAGPTQIAFIGSEGEAQVELLCSPEGTPPSAGAGISIGFVTQALDALITSIGDAGFRISGPISPNPHLRFYMTRDPDGFQVQLCERN